MPDADAPPWLLPGGPVAHCPAERGPVEHGDAPPEAPVAGAATTAVRTPWRAGRGPRLVAALLLALLAATVVLVNTSATRGLSPFDEATHADYVLQVGQGRLPRTGEPLSQEVLREWSCRGSASPVLVVPPCRDGPLDPAGYPAGGTQYNSAHPPLYYAVTAVVAQAVDAVRGDGLLEAARLTGIGWLTAGLWALLAALRRLGASWTLGTAVASLVAVTPAVMHASSSVNNDASALLAGSLVLWAALRVLQGASSWPLLATVAVVAAALKVVFVLALVPAGVLLLLHLLRTPGDRVRLLRVLGVTAAVTVAAVGLWSVVSASGAAGADNPVLGINTREADRVPVAATLKNLLAAWPPVGRAFVPTGLEQPQLALWVALVPLLLASAPLLGIAASRTLAGRDLSLGAMVGMLSVPVAVQLHTYVTSGYYFPNIAPRYGLCLVAPLALALASAVSGRVGERALAAIAALGVVSVVLALLVELA